MERQIDPAKIIFSILTVVMLFTGHLSAAILFTLLAATFKLPIVWR